MRKDEAMDTPTLFHLMGACFHEDWDLDGTEGDVVETFFKEEPKFAPLVGAEVAAVLAAYQTERQLEEVLDTLGASYRPDPHTGGYRGFLTRIAERARPTSAGGT